MSQQGRDPQAASWRSIAIRPARAEDYDALIALWHAVGSSIEPEGREAREAFLHQLSRFPDLFLVATDGDRIVGVVLGTHDERKGWISRLAVDPAYQRQGIAAALVTACGTAIRARGIGIVTALVESDNAASVALFRKLGYSDEVRVVYFRKANH